VDRGERGSSIAENAWQVAENCFDVDLTHFSRGKRSVEPDGRAFPNDDRNLSSFGEAVILWAVSVVCKGQRNIDESIFSGQSPEHWLHFLRHIGQDDNYRLKTVANGGSLSIKLADQADQRLRDSTREDANDRIHTQLAPVAECFAPVWSSDRPNGEHIGYLADARA
jgi:hypothetical protein